MILLYIYSVLAPGVIGRSGLYRIIQSHAFREFSRGTASGSGRAGRWLTVIKNEIMSGWYNVL